ncbi:MAG: hypothetical protein J6Y77_03040 [Paludibacteraceae bacterium]|nr:hypothetical protein [Paludibacteraceae bacterium]
MKKRIQTLLTIACCLVAGHVWAAPVLVEMRYWNDTDTLSAYAVFPADDGQGGFEAQLARLQDEVYCLKTTDMPAFVSSGDRRLLTRHTPKDLAGFILKTDDGMEYKFVSVKYEAYSLKNAKYQPAKCQFLLQVSEDSYSMYMVHHAKNGQTRLEMAYSRQSAPLSVKSVRGLDIAREFAHCETVMQRYQAGDYAEDESMHLERHSAETIRQIGKAMAIVDYLSNCR